MATRFRELIQTLVEHEVELVVVGGVAMVLHGVPINTLDIDIVYRRTEDNIARLLGALEALDARFSDLTGRKLRPTSVLLRLPSAKLLRTRAGRLDVMGELAESIPWDVLLADAVQMSLEGLSVRVASIAHLIASKELAGRPKDQLHLLHLRSLAERKSK